MPFPVSARGKIVVDSVNTAEAMRAVEAMLRKAKASSVTLGVDRIDFTAGFFRFVTSWNLLGAVNSGSVAFHQRERGVEIHYRLSFVQMLVFVSAMVVLFFGLYPVLAMSPQARVPLPALGVAWLWLFGGNYVITVLRFRSALRSACHAHAAATPTPNQAMQRTAGRSAF